jgi:uncharacterized iron-regulated membrane protein
MLAKPDVELGNIGDGAAREASPAGAATATAAGVLVPCLGRSILLSVWADRCFSLFCGWLDTFVRLPAAFCLPPPLLRARLRTVCRARVPDAMP